MTLGSVGCKIWSMLIRYRHIDSTGLTHQIVKLEVSMDNCGPLTGQVSPDVVHNFVVLFMRTPKSLTAIRVLHCSLLSFYAAPSVAVTSIEAMLLAVAFESDCIRVEGMEPRKRFNGGKPTTSIDSLELDDVVTDERVA